MSRWKYCLLTLGILPLALCFDGFSQTAGSSSPPAPIAQAAQAFAQGNSVRSIVLNASAEWITGSDDESGHATLTANADGSFSVQLELPKSSRTESQTSFVSGQSCNWSGSDAIVHATASHNCMVAVAWFMPSVALHGNQQPTDVTTTIASASSMGLLDVQQQRSIPSGASPDIAALLAHIGTTHLYLDAGTFLPTALFFNMHPDDNSGSDIPVHVVFTNYQKVNGVMIPFRIQRYLNGTLNLDLTVTQASVN